MTTDVEALCERLRERADRMNNMGDGLHYYGHGDAQLDRDTATTLRAIAGERDEALAMANGKVFCSMLSTGVCDERRRTEAAEADRDRLSARVADLERLLEPFAAVGRIIDGPFGPALFPDDADAFTSGCAWTENGERKTLTWGLFRAARDFLAAQKDKTDE